MSVVRSLLSTYRRFQYAICGRSTYGVMQSGVLCHIAPFKFEINHGDVVHPCVRYIPEGYEGHCWWLVYTPYYGADPGMENPILCYAESKAPTPPTEWKVYCEVKGKPEKGYNSDPVLLFTKGQLYVFWREYQTPSILAYGHQVGTFGGIVKEGGIVNEFGPIVWSDDAEIDPEVSPTIIEKDGKYICYAMHLKFHSNWLKRQKPFIKKSLTKLITISDLLGFCGQQKSYGIARWESSKIDQPFRYIETTKFKNCNPLYRPWHMDFFEHQGKIFAILQTNQMNADLCLAYSDDYKRFTSYKKPLITNATIGKLGIYKPTGGSVGDMFYLYYTAQDKQNRDLNKIYKTEMVFEQLKATIREA